jgi:G:T-mismatch repair DNA endonuclease (very short patch repair protein)
MITACGRRPRGDRPVGQRAGVPVPPRRPEGLSGRVFRGTWAVEQGLLTPAQLRSSAWVSLRRDVYADSRLAMTHQVQAAGVSLVMPRTGALAGLTAAALWGAPDLVGADDAVEVVVPPGVRWTPGAGVVVRTAPLDGDVVVGRRGSRLTGRVRTALDLIRRGPLEDAVVLLDQLVHAGVVGLDDVRSAAGRLPRSRGSRLAREVAGLADGLAESPQETRLRLLLLRSGLPAPVAQFRVFDADGLVGRLDFAYPDLKIALEYDGLWHGDRRAFLDDRRRLNRLNAAGWVVIHVTLEDLRRPERLAARIRAARARRLAMINTY